MMGSLMQRGPEGTLRSAKRVSTRCPVAADVPAAELTGAGWHSASLMPLGIAKFAIPLGKHRILSQHLPQLQALSQSYKATRGGCYECVQRLDVFHIFWRSLHSEEVKSTGRSAVQIHRLGISPVYIIRETPINVPIPFCGRLPIGVSWFKRIEL